MTKVALSAPHRLAVAAGAEAIAAGGNALDAALAAATTLVVVYPHQCSLGGDISALVRMPDGTVETVLSLGAAAAGIDVEAIRATGGGMPRQGPLTVTVPGVVAGWIALAQLGAKLELERPLLAAATLAAEGAPVSPGLERAIDSRLTAVQADPGLRAVLMPTGKPARGTFEQAALASTLEQLGGDPGGFYHGALAARLAAGLAQLGSPITVDDLSAHRVDRSPPLMLRTANATWWAAPPPAQGATALALLDADEDGDLLSRARAAHAARGRLLGDPAGGEIAVDGMLHPAPKVRADALSAPRASGDTVAVTAVDETGLCVSLIQSVFQTFGAGLLEPDSGIVLHNRGSAFVVLDDRERHASHPARLEPGLRPPHTLCPLIGESRARSVLVALGCQGGRAQPLILAQVAQDTLQPDRPLQATLDRPRWVVGDRDLGYEIETVLTEPGAAPPALHGLPLASATRSADDRCGHVQVARLAGTPARLEAAADPRADGSATITTSKQTRSRT
jgi:gamma-glutamyltranspeptidase